MSGCDPVVGRMLRADTLLLHMAVRRHGEWWSVRALRHVISGRGADLVEILAHHASGDRLSFRLPPFTECEVR